MALKGYDGFVYGEAMDEKLYKYYKWTDEIL